MIQKANEMFVNKARHVGIIMDGNRRWAKGKGLDYAIGHRKGADTAKSIISTAIDIKIKYLTLYAFSSENWKRDPEEIKGLMGLLRYFLKNEINNLEKSGVRIKVLGDLSLFEDDIKDRINYAIAKTRQNLKINLIIAINYGSRQEITNSIRLILEQLVNNKIQISDVDEKIVSESLYTADLPDPDLIIRTGGDSRLSNFLLWQSAYSELMFIDKPWPDFSKADFLEAMVDFNNRERRFGGS